MALSTNFKNTSDTTFNPLTDPVLDANYFNALGNAVNTLETTVDDKAPINHASTETTYGISTAINYGHSMASNAIPLINATTAAIGTDNGKFAREGHVHPTDTTRAPNAHASTATTYGVGDTSNYGHVKVTNGNGLAISSGTIAMSSSSASANGAMSSAHYTAVARTLSVGTSTWNTTNTAVGTNSLKSLTTSTSNVAVGDSTLSKLTSSSNYNVAVGYGALENFNNTSSPNGSNTAIGDSSLNGCTTGSSNTAIGSGSLGGLTTGYDNVGIGYLAGMRLAQSPTLNQTSNNCIFIGSNSSSSGSQGMSNSIVIGNQISGESTYASASNQITLGNRYITQLRCQVTSITSLSDRRTKEEIELANIEMCLDSVKNLPVHRYKYKNFTGIHLDEHVTGFLADDVEKIFPKAVQCSDEYFPILNEDGTPIIQSTINKIKSGVDNDGNIIYKDHIVEKAKMFCIENVKNITMTEAIPTMWGAIQALSKKIEELEKQIATLTDTV